MSKSPQDSSGSDLKKRKDSQPLAASDPLRKRVTTVQLQDVADSIAVQKRKPVCRRLGVSEDVIAQADEALVVGVPNGPSEAFYTSLKSWMDEQGDEATLFKLTTALKECGYHGVARQLIKNTSAQLHQTESPEERKLREDCLLYTSPSPRDRQKSRMPSSA